MTMFNLLQFGKTLLTQGVYNFSINRILFQSGWNTE